MKVKMLLDFLKKILQRFYLKCPYCNQPVGKIALVQEKKEHEWYEVSHTYVDSFICPACKKGFKIDLKGYWPLVLIIPVSICCALVDYKFALLIMGFSAIGINLLLRYTFKPKKNEDP
jgi:uncharacterized protein YbaR (Trm112 family)